MLLYREIGHMKNDLRFKKYLKEFIGNLENINNDKMLTTDVIFNHLKKCAETVKNFEDHRVRNSSSEDESDESKIFFDLWFSIHQLVIYYESFELLKESNSFTEQMRGELLAEVLAKSIE